MAVGACERQRALHRAHSQGGRLPRRPRAVLRGRALGGAGRLLAVDDRGRDRGPRGCGTDRRRPGRRRPLAPVPRDGGPLPAFHQGLDGHDHGAICRRPLLPAPLPHRRPERGHRLQPRQRQRRRRSALRGRRGLPRADAPRRTPGKRPGRPGFAAGGRCNDRAHYPQRPELLPLRHDPGGQRGRLRRLPRPGPDRVLGRRQAVALAARRQQGLWAPLARALRRARRTASADRRYRRRGGPALGHGPVFLRRWARARAGVGEPGRAWVAVRDRSGHRLDRLRARASGRLRGAADVGAGPGRAPHPVPGRRAPARAARGGARPLRDRRSRPAPVPSRSRPLPTARP